MIERIDPMYWLRGNRAEFYEYAKKATATSLLARAAKFVVCMQAAAVLSFFCCLALVTRADVPVREMVVLLLGIAFALLVLVSGVTVLMAFEESRGAHELNPARSVCLAYRDLVNDVLSGKTVYNSDVGAALDGHIRRAWNFHGVRFLHDVPEGCERETKVHPA